MLHLWGDKGVKKVFLWVDKVIAPFDRVPAPFDKVIDLNHHHYLNESIFTLGNHGWGQSDLRMIWAITLSQVGDSRIYFVKIAQLLCQKHRFRAYYGATTLSPYKSALEGGKDPVWVSLMPNKALAP